MKEDIQLDTLKKDDIFYNYKVSTVSFKDDIVLIGLSNSDGINMKLRLLVDDYFYYGLKKDSIVDIETIHAIQKKEAIILAYRSALRKLAIKDYSVHQMKESLRKKYEISEDELYELVKKLKDNKLLNDSEYTRNRINNLSNASLSIKAIRKKLINDGIAKDIIDKYFIEDQKKELEKVKKKANKYLTSIKGKSVNAKKQTIMHKLINDDFNIEDIKTAIDELDFRKDASLENDLLKLEKEKAYRKYSKKYEGYELKTHMYNYLATKGFNLDSIKEILNEMEY